MRCPFCGHDDTQVKDSRPTEDNSAIRRRRFCTACGSRFTTFERVQLRELIVVKKNGQRAPFDRDKLARSIAIAVRKRPVDPDNFAQRATETDLEEIIERASRRVPALQNAEVMRGVTGVYDMTPDSRPLLGSIPGVDGLHICAGFSGMGFKISPAIGLVMSELVLDGAGRTVDISGFRANRFADNQPIKAEYEYVDD